MRVPQRRSEEERRAREHPDYHLTTNAIERLTRELADLKDRQRPRAIAEVQRTSEMGDRSDNAAYTSAKAQLTRMNTRILSLEDRLHHAVPIGRGSGAAGRVRIGSTVVVASDRGEQRYEILGPQETNPGRGRISYRSPLGAALLGHITGEVVEVAINGRAIRYHITRVE